MRPYKCSCLSFFITKMKTALGTVYGIPQMNDNLFYTLACVVIKLVHGFKKPRITVENRLAKATK